MANKSVDPEAKANMLAMLELGIHPIQTGGKSNPEAIRCTWCDQKFATRGAKATHERMCDG